MQVRGSKWFDVITVGGGALGCAVALEAASRGLCTALLESDDFGAATSANSLGIVHGGLRYLQKFDLRRARISATERSIFLRIAPHIVSPLECAVPTLKSVKRGRMAFAAGLGLNRLVIAGLNKGLIESQRLHSGHLVGKDELVRKAPGLALNAVTGGACWYDGCMQSGERLALALAQSARDHGATVLNHTEALQVLTEDDQIRGVLARDLLTGENVEFQGNLVIDCRGVGVCEDFGFEVLRDRRLAFVKAVNVVIGDQGLQCAVGAPVRDSRGAPVSGRMIFARPWDGTTTVGTWYFEHRPGNGDVTPAEFEGILQATNSAFPGWEVTQDDVLALQVGHMPRQGASGQEVLPIEKPIVLGPRGDGGTRGLWRVQTEKWTTVRVLAEHLIDRIALAEGLSVERSRTREDALCGGAEFELDADQSRILSGLESEQSSRIPGHYGSCAPRLLDYVRDNPDLADPIPAMPQTIRAEIPYVLDHELARAPQDVLRRLMPGSIVEPDARTVEFVNNSAIEHIAARDQESCVW